MSSEGQSFQSTCSDLSLKQQDCKDVVRCVCVCVCVCVCLCMWGELLSQLPSICCLRMYFICTCPAQPSEVPDGNPVQPGALPG